jgi:homoserine dehydrogenase
VAGRGETARAVVDALSVLEGVGCVRQVSDFDPAQAQRQLAGAHLVVEMAGGVTPAFNIAMAALGQGVACVTVNPLLMASHGRVLQNAALGMQAYFGFQGAGFGVPVGDLMGALRPSKVTASFTTAASMAIARMAFRNESLAHVSAHLKMMQVDISDWGGKVTQARAIALRALWLNDELRGAQLRRAGVEQLEPADVRRLREFGLQPVFGAEITEGGIMTGPMAVTQGSALLNTQVQDVLVAETAQGEIVLTHSGDETQRMVAGVIADVRQFMRSPKPMMMNGVRDFGFKKANEPVKAYVRVPFAAREHVLAVKPEIMQERVEGDGLWQAVVAVERLQDIQIGAVGGVVFPINGAWTPAAAGSGGLRLVG